MLTFSKRQIRFNRLDQFKSLDYSLIFNLTCNDLKDYSVYKLDTNVHQRISSTKLI